MFDRVLNTPLGKINQCIPLNCLEKSAFMLSLFSWDILSDGLRCKYFIMLHKPYSAIICLKLSMETLEQGVKYVQS